ncbi:MAG: hypothetical protein ACK5OC_01030, partial [Pirellula sp.]
MDGTWNVPTTLTFVGCVAYRVRLFYVDAEVIDGGVVGGVAGGVVGAGPCGFALGAKTSTVTAPTI